MKAKLLRNMPVLPKRVKQGHPPWLPAGHIIDHPNAFRLVQQGVAVPADKECQQRAGMTDTAMEAATKAYDKAAAGIHMEDFDAYNRGLMVGYKPDGKPGDTWRPGPSWVEGCEDEYYNPEENEDDE